MPIASNMNNLDVQIAQHMNEIDVRLVLTWCMHVLATGCRSRFADDAQALHFTRVNDKRG